MLKQSEDIQECMIVYTDRIQEYPRVHASAHRQNTRISKSAC